MSPGPEGPDGHVGGGGGQEEEGAKLGRARVARIIRWPASLPSGESPADGLVLHRDRPCTPSPAPLPPGFGRGRGVGRGLGSQAV